MIQFSDQEIVNELLVLDSATEVYYLGHNLTLKNCTLVIRVPARDLVIARTQLIDCTIEVKRVLKNFQWRSVHLKGCRFKGRFSGNDFGESPSSPGEASIEGCDFTEASVDASRFLGCDVRTLRLPRWPCFTLFDPVRRWRELRALPWPGDIGDICVEGFADDPPSTVAITYSAPELAKRRGTTPEAIKAVLEKLDGVFF
ncbi:MAG: hypothetical protein ACJ8AT_30365 [Hyalangium sp.]|uniref:hypothetical protein n=1 Tax=Hyalangium sp. TaxID=2028555 RepID=UPI00389A570C